MIWRYSGIAFGSAFVVAAPLMRHLPENRYQYEDGNGKPYGRNANSIAL
jgi:hypothetical protein